MKILITGGTGFIGRSLVEALLAKGNQLTLYTRQTNPKGFSQAVEFCQDLTKLNDLNGFEAVINLAGEPIFDKRWTISQKQILLESRLNITRTLVDLIRKSDNPPHTFISGSASGFYGDLPQSANFYDETTACGTNFTAQICQQWEAEALKAKSENTRVCLVRTGIVLSETGGALKQMLPLYRANLAGKLGSGKQYWAWISLQDHIQAVIFLLENANCAGAFNLVAPTPVANAEFNRELAKSLHRCAVFGVPAFVLNAVLGERSQILLDNQPLMPRKLLEAGFDFQHLKLNFALFRQNQPES